MRAQKTAAKTVTVVKLVKEAKSRKVNKSSFKHTGKQSLGSYPTQCGIAANQPARPLFLQSEAGTRNRPSIETEKEGEMDKDREREREMECLYTKLLILPFLSFSFYLMLWVKVTSADNCITGKLHN